ncbi:2131_t:CDS:10 [Ambispora leptoticha]|uniref:ethanolamine kinase n=1 Tax=Ambispora leptoticha TaxID=144679 RepID=A0A9N8Z2Z1_9GLOM|nr:2131_t:CDS:10 [Ambispora leptoticha]
MTSTSNEIDVTSTTALQDYIAQTVKTLDYSIDLTNLFKTATHVLLNVFPDWDEQELEFFEIASGLTNKLVKVTNKQTGVVVLVRIFGRNSERFINREEELLNVVALSILGLAAPLYAKFNNGVVYGYIPGEPFAQHDLPNMNKSALVAKHLAKFHRVEIAGSKKPVLFDKIRRWLNQGEQWNGSRSRLSSRMTNYSFFQVPEKYTDPKVNEKFASNLNLKRLKEELYFLEEQLAKPNYPVVFCHNDLLYPNIIYKDENSVTFIDFEYGGYNYRGFDIGNHFNTFAGWQCDYSLYPTKEFQLVWLRHYLSSFHPETEVTDAEVENLYREVAKFQLASLFYCSVWTLLSSEFSDIKYDFMEYAVRAFREYYRIRDEMNDKPSLPTETMIRIFSEVAEKTGLRRVWKFRCVSREMKLIIEMVVFDKFRNKIKWRIAGWSFDGDKRFQWEYADFNARILAPNANDFCARIRPITKPHWSLRCNWYEFWVRVKGQDQNKWYDLSERIEHRKGNNNNNLFGEKWFGNVKVVYHHHHSNYGSCQYTSIPEFKIDLKRLFSLIED